MPEVPEITDKAGLAAADVAELERLMEAATPGPWYSPLKQVVWRRPFFDGKRRRIHQPICDASVPSALSEEQKEANAQMISLMRNALPALLQRLRELTKALDQIAAGDPWPHISAMQALGEDVPSPSTVDMSDSEAAVLARRVRELQDSNARLLAALKLPEPSEHDIRNCWSVSTEYIAKIQETIVEPDKCVSWEQIEAVLKADYSLRAAKAAYDSTDTKPSELQLLRAENAAFKALIQLEEESGMLMFGKDAAAVLYPGDGADAEPVPLAEAEPLLALWRAKPVPETLYAWIEERRAAKAAFDSAGKGAGE